MMNGEERSVHINDHKSTSNETETVLISKLEKSAEMDEETSNNRQSRKPNLFLDIPARTMDESHQDFVQIKMPPTPTPTPKRVNFKNATSSSNSRPNPSPGNGLSSTKSSIKNYMSKLSFKQRGAISDVDMEAEADSTSSNVVPGHEKVSIAPSWSLSKMLTPILKRAPSLPVTPRVIRRTSSLPANQDAVPGGSINGHVINDRKEAGGISRSLSVPVIYSEKKGIRKADYFFRVIPTPRPKEGGSELALAETEDDENIEVNGEDIPEEEAVCRICFVELCEGETLKLECSCKGELALAHEECAVKWFAIKGNRTCDICKEEVRNLSVTLLRIESSVNRNSLMRNFRRMEINGHRVWQDLPILVIVSTLAYFCFLEQLLVEKMGGTAVAMSLPFSCVLGLFSSMTSSTMVRRKFVWVYAAIQFALVVLFAHVFYDLVHVQAIISIILSAFGGFGFAMSGCSVIMEVLRWRTRREARLNQSEVYNQIMLNHGLRPPPADQTESPC